MRERRGLATIDGGLPSGAEGPSGVCVASRQERLKRASDGARQMIHCVLQQVGSSLADLAHRIQSVPTW